MFADGHRIQQTLYTLLHRRFMMGSVWNGGIEVGGKNKGEATVTSERLYAKSLLSCVVSSL